MKIESKGVIISSKNMKKSSRYIVGKHVLLTVAIDPQSKDVMKFLDEYTDYVTVKIQKRRKK